MFTWFTHLPDAAKAAIMGALVGSLIAAIIALLTMLIKDYWIPILGEKRNADRTRRLTFKKYANPLTVCSIALLYRLREILTGRGQYLLPDAPQNEFTRYKHISTLYRLCSLLGWIRASELELSHIEVKNSRRFLEIQDAMFGFAKSLADGHGMELAIVEDLCRVLKIEFSAIPKESMEMVGVEVEVLIFKWCEAGKVDWPVDLPGSFKFNLTRAAADCLCERAGQQPITDNDISISANECAREMSRKDGFIYRDWQSAVGDVMIKNVGGPDPRYEVIGYKAFEELYESAEPSLHKWIDRADRVFKGLNVEVIERFDNRPVQLRAVYESTHALLGVLAENRTSNVNIAKKALTELPERLP